MTRALDPDHLGTGAGRRVGLFGATYALLFPVSERAEAHSECARELVLRETDLRFNAGCADRKTLGVVNVVVRLAAWRPLRYHSSMGEQARRLLEEVLRLPIQDRAGFATEIIASLDGEADPGAEAAWAVEVEARARRALADPKGGTDWEIVRARVESKLRRG